MRKAKKVLAMVLMVCMVCTLLSTPIVETKVQAAEAEGIISGATYIIKSAMDQEKVIMPTNSAPGWTYVSMFDKTGSNSQKWIVQYNGSNYTVKNVGTGFHLHYGEGIKDAHVDQNGFDNSDYYKWNLVKATSSNDPNGYMLEAVRKDGEGNPVYATAGSSDNGVELFLRNRDDANLASQIWYFEQVDNVANTEVTEEMVHQAAKAYLNRYLVDTTQSDGSVRKSLGGGFWIGAELCEMMLDGYENSGDNTYRSAFESSYQDLLNNIGNRYSYWQDMTETDWSANPFNDDVMWLVIASVRAHLMFGSSTNGYKDYLTYAKNNFQMAIDRGMLLDGTMRWSHQDGEGEGTTSCINGPTVVAACYLAKATGDDSYYELARSVHAAQRKTMFIPETGQVWDSPTNEAPLTYNAGTWLGSCVMLYERYGDQQYLDDAVKTMDFLMKNNGRFCNGYGIMTHENSVEGDLSAFRAILMRYMRKFIVEMDDKVDMTKYIQWMQKNAKVAYNNQNSSGLILNPWFRTATNDEDYGSSGMSGGVSLLLNLPTYSDTVKKNAYERIEAEDFDYVKGVMTEGTQDSDGNRQIGGVQNGHYTGYANVQFGDKGAGSIELRVSTAVDGGYVEIRLDNPNGRLLGVVDLPYTRLWESYETVSCNIENVTGTHTIYLVYKNDISNFVCNLNWLKFSEKFEPVEGAVAIKFGTSQKYLSTSDDETGKITVKSNTVGKWEQFIIVQNEDGTVSFQSAVNKKYVSVIMNGENGNEENPYLSARSDSIQDAEKFIIESLGGDSFEFAIKAKINDKYLQFNVDSTNVLITVDGDNATSAATAFSVETVEGEVILPSGVISRYQVNYYKQNTDRISYTEITEDGFSENANVGVTVNAPEKTYAGFTKNVEKSIESGQVSHDGSLVLKVYFDRNVYDINYEGIEGITNGNTLPAQYVYGIGVTLQEPVKEGYTFDGWYTESEYKNRLTGISTEEMKDVTLYAKFTKIESEEPKEEGGDTPIVPDDGKDEGNTPGTGESEGVKPGDSNAGKTEEKPTNPGQSNNQNVISAKIAVGKTFVSGKFYYKVTKVTGTVKTVRLTKAKKKTYTSLTIPQKVKYKGVTFTVTSIGKNAFKYNKKLKKVTIGKGITSIGSKAFYGCAKLTRVTIKSKSLKKVGSKAFTKTNSKLRIKVGTKKNIKKYARLLKKKIPKSAKIVK